MFNLFFKTFAITTRGGIENDKDLYKSIPKELFELLNYFGGSTFNNGLYRLHSFKSSIKWSILIADYFEHYRNKILPFGFDWMGRQFCINLSGDTIFMFDPATIEAFELQKSLAKFHNDNLVNDMLSASLYNHVLTFCGVDSIDRLNCLGYKIPLFLGGKDAVENYEMQNIEVYWHVTSQLYKKVKDMPDGTKIGNIKIE